MTFDVTTTTRRVVSGHKPKRLRAGL